MPGLHHVGGGGGGEGTVVATEVWIADVGTDLAPWGWLLARLGFVRESSWPEGESWAAGGTYLSLTTSPNVSAGGHDRRRPGVNHLAFKAGERETVDAIMAEAPLHGWTPLYQDRYPHAGGEQHYAGWLENSAGFKAEVVADVESPASG